MFKWFLVYTFIGVGLAYIHVSEAVQDEDVIEKINKQCEQHDKVFISDETLIKIALIISFIGIAFTWPYFLGRKLWNTK